MTICVGRRESITLLGGAAAWAARGARAAAGGALRAIGAFRTAALSETLSSAPSDA
jgi:hypothetical protein